MRTDSKYLVDERIDLTIGPPSSKFSAAHHEFAFLHVVISVVSGDAAHNGGLWDSHTAGTERWNRCWV